MPVLRPVIAAALLVLSLATGCSGSTAGESAPPPATSVGNQAGSSVPVYEGPDEFTMREQFMPVMAAGQRAAEASLGEVRWLEEAAFQHRQSMDGSVVASLYVMGTTQATADRADAWVSATSDALVAHGFEAVSQPATDAGGGLMLWSRNKTADACFSARWGQGSVAITVEVAGSDTGCR